MTEAASGLGSLQALGPATPRRVQVKDSLIELIITRRLRPGQHLAEVEVARQLSVSRIPVREALQALQLEGWVDLVPGRGAFVHEATHAEVAELFAVRVILEEESARLAASNVTDEDITVLRHLCVLGRQAFGDDDETGVVEHNAALHRHVSTMAGNRTLTEMIASLDRRVRWHFTPIAKRRGLSSWDEHDDLIDALVRHDAPGAAAVMRTHVEHSRDAVGVEP